MLPEVLAGPRSSFSLSSCSSSESPPWPLALGGLKKGRGPISSLIVLKATSISSVLMAYSPIIHNAALYTCCCKCKSETVCHRIFNVCEKNAKNERIRGEREREREKREREREREREKREKRERREREKREKRREEREVSTLGALIIFKEDNSFARVAGRSSS